MAATDRTLDVSLWSDELRGMLRRRRKPVSVEAMNAAVAAGAADQ